MVLMGHKKLETTQRYMHLINYGEEENVVAGATTAEEATQLIEKRLPIRHNSRGNTTLQETQKNLPLFYCSPQTVNAR
jgi:hypothetical protein